MLTQAISPSQLSFCAYRLGVRLQQLEMLLDPAAQPCWLDGRAEAIIASLQASFDKLATSLGLSQSARKLGDDSLQQIFTLSKKWSKDDLASRPAVPPVANAVLAIKRSVEAVAAANPLLDACCRFGREIVKMRESNPDYEDWDRIEKALQELFDAVPDEEKMVPAPLSIPKKKKKGRKRLNLSKEAEAIAVLFDHPDWADQRIANELGVPRSTLAGWSSYKAARAAMRLGCQEFPQGRKSKGNLEAFDEDGAKLDRQSRSRRKKHKSDAD
jgi:hypothetical protein